MSKNWVIFTFIFLLLLSGFSSASATPPPAKIVSSIVTNVVSSLVKWLWSLKSNAKTGVSSRSMVKFESGYTVETVFDGNKVGIEPHSVKVSPNGDELLVLDSHNSNIYKISTPLSRYSRPKLIAGSSEGYTGHVDGKLREARMDHPKGFTMDDRGNIYIADTSNMAIRKINDGGFMTTIAGGKWGRGGGGHVDGPSEDAKFSNDFDVAYIGSSCSLLVIDRGNQAIREIQLRDDDCERGDYQSYDGSFNLGIAVLVVAALFGYLLALLQRKVQSLFSWHDDSRSYMKKGGTPIAPYHKPPPRSVRPPLIPDEDEEHERPEDGFFGSLGKLGSTVGEIFGVLFSGFRRKPVQYQFQQEYQQQQFKHNSNTWPMQESFVIPDEDEPPSIDSRTSTPKKTYPNPNHNQFKQSQGQGYYNEWESGEYNPQQQQKMQMKRQQQQQYHQRHYTSNPKTYYQKSCETNEIVFGAVQEQDGRREAVVIKAVDYGDPRYSHHSIRPPFNYVGYSHQGY